MLWFSESDGWHCEMSSLKTTPHLQPGSWSSWPGEASACLSHASLTIDFLTVVLDGLRACWWMYMPLLCWTYWFCFCFWHGWIDINGIATEGKRERWQKSAKEVWKRYEDVLLGWMFLLRTVASFIQDCYAGARRIVSRGLEDARQSALSHRILKPCRHHFNVSSYLL